MLDQMKPINEVDIALNGGLVGAQMERANLRGRNLSGANFDNANLRGADLTDANLRGCSFVRADLSRACLLRADCRDTDFSGADLTASYMKAANFTDAYMPCSILKRVCAKQVLFIRTNLSYADFLGGEFLGARFNDAILYHIRNKERAIFHWYMPVGGGKPKYQPTPGHYKLSQSWLGGLSFRENAGRHKWEDR